MKQLAWLPVLLGLAGPAIPAAEGPFDGRSFKGRIAYSSDGNFNDEDDWAASPIALAIFAQYGVKAKLVHFDYNSILSDTNPAWEKQHETSVLGAAERFGYKPVIFHNCRRDLDAAVESIRNAINASSADNPLYFIIAGPMEVPYLGIMKSDPEKRQFVYAISHSRWNDGYDAKFTHRHNKRSVIPSGVRWVQIADQNKYLSTSPFGRPAKDEEWQKWQWMRESKDPNVRFLWDRMRATTRADGSDAGMAYFLLTGDEEGRPSDLQRLLEHKLPFGPAGARKSIRVEAENFRSLENYDVEDRNDRLASHRLNVKLAGTAGRLRAVFDEPYSAPAARYDVDVRYLGEKGEPYRLSFLVNGVRQGGQWTSSADEQGWKTHTIQDVTVKSGDEIAVEVDASSGGSARLDYVQLNRKSLPAGPSPARFTASGPLDDPEALPGQVIVAGGRPGYLKHNGGGPVFLSGPDNPEEFLYRGTLNPDGTRSGGAQEETIERMAQTGVNAFHAILFRMQKPNIKNEGDDQHSPFLGHDPSRPLNEAVLDQWDRWLTLFEQKGIIVDLEFYNDATDVERIGWVLDSGGNLHPDEQRWIEGIVRRFSGHKNILWSIEESCNKLPAARTRHFQKIAELIAKTDKHHHPIVQSFVVPDDPEGDFPKDGIFPEAYAGDPNVRLVTWLHVVEQGSNIEKMHQVYLGYSRRDRGNFVVLKNETFHHPRGGALSRRYMWSAAMAGLHTMEAYHHADAAALSTLEDDARIALFMEQTDFHRMQPRDDVAAGSARWALASPGRSYIAYTYNYSGPMGIQGLTPGVYDLLWFDTLDGRQLKQAGVSVQAAEGTWAKPESFSNEVALYVKRR